MKTINVPFEDSEYESLKEVKKEVSWHDFILQLIKKESQMVIENHHNQASQKALENQRLKANQSIDVSNPMSSSELQINKKPPNVSEPLKTRKPLHSSVNNKKEANNKK